MRPKPKRSSRKRFILEGTWSGYTARQERVVHRSIIDSPKMADAIKNQYGIRFADGTMLILSVRPMEKGERAKNLINGYGKLIEDCYYAGVWSVDELHQRGVK